jgi:separase
VKPSGAGLPGSMQALSLAETKTKESSTSSQALSLPSLWPLVTSLHLGFVQTANVYRHLGLIQESIYFVNEALRVVRAVNAKSMVDWTQVMLADLKIRGGKVEEGTEILEAIRQSATESRAMVSLEIAAGNLEKLNGDFDSEMEAYRRADRLIDGLLAQVADKPSQEELVQQ